VETRICHLPRERIPVVIRQIFGGKFQFGDRIGPCAWHDWQVLLFLPNVSLGKMNSKKPIVIWTLGQLIPVRIRLNTRGTDASNEVQKWKAGPGEFEESLHGSVVQMTKRDDQSMSCRSPSNHEEREHIDLRLSLHVSANYATLVQKSSTSNEPLADRRTLFVDDSF
jgi:hypothetical protein